MTRKKSSLVTNGNFADAIAQGIANAHSAATSHDEIEAVLTELEQSLAKAGNGRATTKTRHTPADGEPGCRHGTTQLDVVHATQSSCGSKPFLSIQTAVMGYPVGISYRDENITCKDRGELVTSLRTICASATFGRMLTDVMDYNLPQPAHNFNKGDA